MTIINGLPEREAHNYYSALADMVSMLGFR